MWGARAWGSCGDAILRGVLSTAAPRRSRGPFLLGLLGIVLFGSVATYLMFLAEPPPPPRPANVRPAAVAAPKPQQLTLSQLAGVVEVKSPDGTWRPAKAGDVLKPSDGVRTQDGAYAVIVGGEYWEVKMEPEKEIVRVPRQKTAE